MCGVCVCVLGCVCTHVWEHCRQRRRGIYSKCAEMLLIILLLEFHSILKDIFSLFCITSVCLSLSLFHCLALYIPIPIYPLLFDI